MHSRATPNVVKEFVENSQVDIKIFFCPVYKTGQSIRLHLVKFGENPTKA